MKYHHARNSSPHASIASRPVESQIKIKVIKSDSEVVNFVIPEQLGFGAQK